MPTALIADDEPFMRAALRDHLASLWPELEVIDEAEDGPQALRKIEMRQPDIAFLDIQMPGLTGLQVAQAITARSRVVFVTADDSHAVAAFEANAVDYVLKPLEPARLAKLVAKLNKSLTAEPISVDRIVAAMQHAAPAAPAPAIEWLQVDGGKAIRMVHVDDVMYFESDAKYTRVVADDGVDGLIRLSLKELLGALDPRLFLQTHRGMVVNRRFIRSVHRVDDNMELEIKGRQERLKVSHSNHHLFKAM